MLLEMVDAIHADDAIAGVHCCGNTDWTILVDARVDLLNFDAFEFGETIALYPEAVKTHLESGRSLAWGVVPTSPEVRKLDVVSLTDHLEKMITNLARHGIDRELLIERAVITPSCGTGSMKPADAEKVFELTQELSGALRKKYNFQ